MNLQQSLKDYLGGAPLKNIEETVEQMLNNIGTTDPNLRDKLIYSSFCKLISDHQLSISQLNRLLETCSSNDFLFYKIGEVGTDSVFTRSFSSLVLAALVEFDIREGKLDSGLIQNTINKAVDYMEREKDTRGFVEDKGWAHAIAHGADMIDAIVKHHLFNISEVDHVFSAVSTPLFYGHAYTDNEDERLALAIYSLLKTHGVDDLTITWLSSLTGKVEEMKELENNSIHSYRVQHSIKNFLKSLYFILLNRNEFQLVQSYIQKQLKEWDSFL